MLAIGDMSYNISGMLLRCRRALWAGFMATMVVGYFYGIVRANLDTTFGHFIFDFGVIGFLSGANNAQGHPYSAFQDAPDHALDIGAHGMAPSDNASAAAASTGSVGWIARAYFLRAIYIGWCDAGRAGDAQDRSRPGRSQPDRKSCLR